MPKTKTAKADRAAANHEAALAAFMQAQTGIEALLAELQSRAADHFGADPDTLNWGHVGDLARIAYYLRLAAGHEA
jgi:hypothetical protein